MTNGLPIHPDDVLFFHEVCGVMRVVARQYELPLRTISHTSMPARGMNDFLGRCFGTGDIELVLRATVDGQWCDAPRTPADVWRTAAHELAHLRHMNHGVVFQEFEEELREAVANRQEDHQDKVIRRLIKLQASRDGEAAVGNSAAAEAFAGMINRMLIEYELSPSDLDYARAADRDPVIEIRTDLKKYKYPLKKTRIAWEESLARVVAKAHLCSFLIQPRTNNITFVGTRAHATVAEYVYGTLLPIASRLADDEYYDYHMGLRRQGKDIRLARGFRPAWLSAFVERIAERFEEARRAAVVAVPEGTSTGLMRLNGAIIKVQQYIDDKFRGRRGHADALNGGTRFHKDGRDWGRNAADRMTLGRRGLTGGNSPTRGLLK